MNSIVITIVIFLMAGGTIAPELNIGSNLSSQEFVDKAAIASESEIETAITASTMTTNPLVLKFAEAMITEQPVLLNSLRSFAQAQKLHIGNEVQLKHEARTYIFQRKGKTLDSAYADGRLRERKKVVDLFREAIKSDNPVVQQYAKEKLPVLMRHLYMAQTLVNKLNGN